MRPYNDRISETTSTVGTSDIALSGASPGSYITFSSVYSVGDTIPYCVVNFPTNEWEVGYGTLSSPTTLQRTTITSSSSGGSIVSFSSGTKTIFNTLPGDFIRRLRTNGTSLAQASGNVPF